MIDLSILMLSREGNFLFKDKHLQAFHSLISDAIYSKLVFKSKFHDPYEPQAGTFTFERLWQCLLPFIRGLLSGPEKCWRERLNGHRPLMGRNYHKETNIQKKPNRIYIVCLVGLECICSKKPAVMGDFINWAYLYSGMNRAWGQWVDLCFNDQWLQLSDRPNVTVSVILTEGFRVRYW